MAVFLSETLGTLILVLIGCGAAVLGVGYVDQVGIALAFGLAVVAVFYGLGPVSGAHVNPAVSLAVFLAGRMGLGAMLLYWAAQFLGALLGAAILAAIAGFGAGLGQNGWGETYAGGYPLAAAALFEIVMTGVFAAVVLAATAPAAPRGFAGLAIGAALAAIHMAGLAVTGVSVNPARSFGPAVLVGGQALAQLWLFLVAPLAGAALAGGVCRLGVANRAFRAAAPVARRAG